MIMDDATIAERMFGTTPPPAAPAQPSAGDIAAERMFGATAPKPEAPTTAKDPVARLFGGPDAEPAPEEPRQPRTDEELQAILYPEPEKPAPLADAPPEVQELRDLPERRMFDAQSMLRDAVPELTDEQCDEHGLDPDAMRQGTAEVREIAADLDLGALDVRDIRTRAERLQAEPVDVITQRESAVEALNREFGSGAHQAWLDARALVARDPRVGKMIEAMGLGDDADTIVMLAKKARSQRAAGKFKGRE
jgi:hypothetical protein